MRRAMPLIALLTVAACGSGDNPSAPGGVTGDEARALGDAAEMIDERRIPEEKAPPPSAAR